MSFLSLNQNPVWVLTSSNLDIHLFWATCPLPFLTSYLQFSQHWGIYKRKKQISGKIQTSAIDFKSNVENHTTTLLPPNKNLPRIHFLVEYFLKFDGLRDTWFFIIISNCFYLFDIETCKSLHNTKSALRQWNNFSTNSFRGTLLSLFQEKV